MADPYERFNRKTHAFNLAIDKSVLRPISVAYYETLGRNVGILVSNFSSNLSTPLTVVNNVLQADIENAVKNTSNFVINSTIGFGGIAKPAENIGIIGNKTKFGDTLHHWGVREGAYVVLPFLGPSTSRDTAAIFVDRLINPVGQFVPSKTRIYFVPVNALKFVGDRGRLASTIDSVLYDSADSYAQTRIIYLQRRRYELRDQQEDYYFDPYADEDFKKE